MNFTRAIDIILEHEGGYVKNPNDPGGETNFGICKRSYPNIDIWKLTREQACEIYYKDFWDKHSLHLFPPGLNLMFFDCAINQGPVNAIKFLQEAVKAPITGRLVFDDIEKIDDFDLELVMKKFIFLRAKKYSSSKNFLNFGKGWLNRLLSVSVDSIYASKESSFPSMG